MNREIPAVQRAVQLVGPDQLVLHERKPVPAPGPHQILARSVAVGLCFSDLKLLKQFAGHVRKAPVISGVDPEVLRALPSYVPGEAPTVPGHEPVVEIAAVGPRIERFRPGERYFIQADWRWLKTPQSNGALGYNFEGALQEYVLLDERLLVSPEGETMLLPAPAGERSASAYALVEPWACVENSYQTRERRALKTDGRALVVADDPAAIPAIAALWRNGPRPAALDWTGVPPPDGLPRRAERRPDLAATPKEGYDDIVYAGHDPDRLGGLFEKAARDGRLWVATCGGRFGRPVKTALGAVHYFGLRIAGTTGADPAEAMAAVPETGEIRDGDVIHIIGAGGPMGVMHVVRNLSSGRLGVRIVAADLSDERLTALRRLAQPLAERGGLGLECYNSKDGAARPTGERYDYTVVLAPVPALVAQAVSAARPGGRINIFAGIPLGTTGPIDMDTYVERRLYMFGTSGSTLRDMRIVLDHVRGGRLDTNVSVAAVGGLDGAIEGIRAIERQEIAGKIVVYPACRGLRLTPLAKLPEAVHAKLRDGVWTREAEAKLLADFSAA
jgi:threonine dehydrogenase-like Zn-dependent dehydrogenase